MVKKPLARNRNSANGKRSGVSPPTTTPTATPTATPPTRPARLPRIAKGHRPEFYDDPAIDQLFAIVTALTGELSVLFDRLDTMERLLAEAKVLSLEAIEAYVPDGAAAAVRVERRDELLRRVFAVLELYAARKHAARKAAAPRAASA
jgi:hypothetical protein